MAIFEAFKIIKDHFQCTHGIMFNGLVGERLGRFMYYANNSSIEIILWGGEVLSNTLSVSKGWLVWSFLNVAGLLRVILECNCGIKLNSLVTRGVGKVHVLC